MGWKCACSKGKAGLTIVSAAAVATALSVGTALWQPQVTGQEQAGELKTAEPKTTASEREAAPAAKRHANELSLAFRRAAELATPAVVRVNAHTKAKAVKSTRSNPRFRGGENPFKGTPFEDFFREMPEGSFGLDDRMPQRDGMGSGVIIDPSGTVITNNHVVAGADVVTVRLSDGREFKATDIKTDPSSDLAVLRLKDAKNLPAAKLGDSSELAIGDWVLAIGNPFDQQNTVSAGIISGKGRHLSSIESHGVLADRCRDQSRKLRRAAGEPRRRSRGHQHGDRLEQRRLSRHWLRHSQQPGQVGHAAARRARQRPARYLGVNIGAVTPDLAEELNVRAGEGVVVMDVVPKSPAAEAGVQEADVIVGFNGKSVKEPRELQELVERTPIGEERPSRCSATAKQQTLKLVAKALPKTIATRSDSEEAAEEEPAADNSYRDKNLGLEVADLSAAEVSQFDGQKGVLIQRVEPESAAAREGLRAGMLIRKVGRTTVTNVEEYAEAVKKNLDKNGVLLSVRTGAGNRLVVVNPEEE